MTLRSKWLFAVLLGITALAVAQTYARAAVPAARPSTRGAVQIEVRNSLFHVTDDIVVTVTRLDGWMVPRTGQVVSLDHKNTFTLQINAAETRMKDSDLTSLMNEYLLPHAKAPMKNINITFENGMVKVKGELHKVMDVPFEGKGEVSIADPSDIRLHFTELTVAGVVRKGVLDLFGVQLAKVAQPKKENRFYITGDDIILPIQALFPPPRISGSLTAVRIEGDSLVQTLGPVNAKLSDPPVQANEYIYFHGGRIQFGKLIMNDTDLELLNEKPAPQFDFSLDHYYVQLQNGYTKLLPNRGVVFYMPGYATVAPQAKRE
jgi:hypothetical protein